MFFGTEALKADKRLYPVSESIVNIDSVVYTEYLNRKSMLESCTDEEKKTLLEAQCDILLEVSIQDIKDRFIKAFEAIKKRVIAIGRFIKEKIIDAAIAKIRSIIARLKKKKEENKDEKPKEEKSEETSEKKEEEEPIIYTNKETGKRESKKADKLNFKIYYLDLDRFLNWKADKVVNWLQPHDLHSGIATIEDFEGYLIIDELVARDIYGNIKEVKLGELDQKMSKSDFMTSMQRFSFEDEEEMKKQPIFKYLKYYTINFDAEKDPMRLIVTSELEKWEKSLTEDSKKLDDLQKTIMHNLDDVEEEAKKIGQEKLDQNKNFLADSVNKFTAMKDIMTTNIKILEVAIRLVNVSISSQIHLLEMII